MKSPDATKTITSPRKTRRLPDDATGINTAAEILNGGGIVALPTETVYGLAARIDRPSAITAIFAAKDRPAVNPLIVHVGDTHTAAQLVHFNDTAHRLADLFWPGALTLVLPKNPEADIPDAVTGGLETLAIRAPAHETMRAVLAKTGPLAAPSANRSGRLSPTRAAHVIETLEGRIDGVIDGGHCASGLESTVVRPCEGHVDLLRAGTITAEAITEATGLPVHDKTGGTAEAPSSPGQLFKHYAPRTALQLNEQGPLMLGFGGLPEWAEGLDLSATGNLDEAARNLFAMLHRLDHIAQDQDHAFIYVAPIPDEGVGRAINDRLRRAAAASAHLDPHKPHNGQSPEQGA